MNWTQEQIQNFNTTELLAYGVMDWTADQIANFTTLERLLYERNSTYIPEEPVKVTLPSASFLADYTFTYPVDSGSLYYDPKTKLPKGNKLTEVRISIPTYYGADTIQIVAISLNETIIETIPVAGIIDGLNSIAITRTFDQDVYIGVRANATRIGLDVSKYDDGLRYAVRYQKDGETFWRDGVYPMGLQIITEDYSQTTVGKFKRIFSELSTDDTAELTAKIARGGLINLEPGRIYTIINPILIKKPCTINGNGAILQSAGTMFNINKVEGVKIRDTDFRGFLEPYAAENYAVAGPLNVPENVRNLLGIGNEIAIEMDDIRRINIDGCHFSMLSGHGIKAKNFNADYQYGIKVNNNYFFNNYSAIHLSNQAEYSQYNGNTISRCQIGIYNDAGNNTFANNDISGNRCCFYLGGGYNNAHGNLNGGSINHASKWGILAEDVSQGFVFKGFENWGAHSEIYRSKGILISGAQIHSNLTVIGNHAVPGRNAVSGCMINGEIFNQSTFLVLDGNIGFEGAKPSINNNEQKN